MTQLQNLTRKLSAAGHARSHDGKYEYLLVVDKKQSSLRCQRWSGDELIKDRLVVAAVRPGSTAAYLTTLTDTFVIYITPSSTLGAYTFHERERRWVEADDRDKNAPPAYIVDGDGKLAAIADAGGRIHLVFQDSADRLRYLDHSWNTTVLPGHPLSGSPLAILAVGDTIHVFYVSAVDHLIHAVVFAKNTWKDDIFIEQGFKRKVHSLVAEESQHGIELIVMTEDESLFKISIPKASASPGVSRKARRVHGCVNNAWNGTLADANLQFYLKRDPGCLDKPGGDHALTPLAAACITGRLGTVLLILQHGGNPNALSSQKRSPLFFATSTKEPRDRCAIVRALLKSGARPDDAYAETGFATPLMNAVAIAHDRNVVLELLDHGASPNSADAGGKTPAEVGRATGMADLFPLNVDVESTVTSFGQSPVSPEGVEVPSTTGTSLRILSPDPSPVLKRSTRRISNEANDTEAQKPEDDERPSLFEAKIIDFLAAMLMLLVTYTGSERVKETIDQAARKLTNKGRDDENVERQS